MYWVFNLDQVRVATAAYVERTCGDDDEKQATTNLICEFLTSKEAQSVGMVKGEINNDIVQP